MNDLPQTTISTPAGAGSLWTAIGVLSVAVIALGSALYFVQTQQGELRAANRSSEVSPPGVAPAPVAAVSEQLPTVEKKQSSAPRKRTLQAVKPAATQADKPVATASAAAPPAVAPKAKDVCLHCGTVMAVTGLEREGPASGAGAVAGGVLGAVVGNQVGGGDGKTVATILGAIGGGIAGNAVEKKMKKETVFQVQVRMDDGSTRSFEQATPVGEGVRVRVEGGILQPLAPLN